MSTYLYNTNDIPITTNCVDPVVKVETGNSEAKPTLNYAYLDDRAEDGLLFTWITMAINLSSK